MDIGDVDINLLLAFEALCKTNNVTAAGTLIGLSQSATSYTLSRLRTVFDDPLFVRTPSGMQPTPYAKELQEPVSDVLKLIRTRVVRKPPFDPSRSRRRFVINMTDVAQLTFLPMMLSYFEKHAPHCELEAVDLDMSVLERAFEEGDIDLAYGYYPNLKGAGLYQQRLFEHSFVCLVRRDHPRIKTRPTLQRFLAESHILVRPEGRSPEIFEKALRDRGLTRNIRLVIPNFMGVPLVVASSDFVVTVPISLGHAFVKFADVKMLRPPIPVPDYAIRQHWHGRLHKDESNVWLRRAVQAVFSPLDGNSLWPQPPG
jgi:DNA-binding transcriptional LysR family regulator